MPSPTFAAARAGGRRARSRLVGLAVGGVALVAAACQPVAPPPPPPPQPVAQYCAASAPVTPADYQADFNNLRTTYTEWASADGEIPVALPDGRTVWMFGDTFVGHVDAGGLIDPADPIVHNSFVVQDGACFAPLMGGVPLARSELIPDPALGQFYWPASGVVSGTSLEVFCWHMEATGTGLGFQTLGMSVATFALPSLQLEGTQALPFSFDATTMPFGATALANTTGSGADGDVYLYGESSESTYVARAPIGDLLATPSAWQVWTAADPTNPSDPSNWSSTASAAQPIAWDNFTANPIFGTGNGPLAQPWVVPYKTGADAYLVTAKSLDVFSSDVSVFTAPDPWGPFTFSEQPVTNAPNSSTQVSYGAFTLNATSASPSIVYSTNQNSLADVPQPPYSIQEYGPNFVAPQTPLP